MADVLAEYVKSMKEVERVGEEITVDRRKIVELDRKRNDNRVALRSLKESSVNVEPFTWSVSGDSFFRLETEKVIEILNNEQKEIDSQIDELNAGLKTKVNKLRKLENQPELKGFGLNPLSKSEADSINQIFGK